MIRLRFVINPLNFPGEMFSLLFKFNAFRFSQDNHKTDAILSCV